MQTTQRHKLLFLAAWVVVLAFFAWTVDLLIGVQRDWAQSNEITRVDQDVRGLFNPWRNLNRPGNDVLENYAVEAQSRALDRYLAEYRAARLLVEAHRGGSVPMDAFLAGIDEAAESVHGLATQVLDLAREREALREAGAAPALISEVETRAATSMAHMDQAFQSGLDLLAVMDQQLDNRRLELDVSRRAAIRNLYLIVLVTLLSLALSLLLLRRTARQGKALREGAERLRLAASVFENTTEGILITDGEARIQSTNPAFTAITGYTADEVVGRNPRILQSGQQSVEFYKEMWRSIGETGHWAGEIVNRRKNGEVYPQWLNINAITDRQGRVINYVGVTFDISELKASERMKDEFIATVSHELRTPLTSIHGALRLMGSGVGGKLSADSDKLVRIAQDNSERLVRLIDDILSIAKIESERMPFKLQPVTVDDLVAKGIEANQEFAKQFDVKLHAEPGMRNARVLGDKDRLMQVMTNLLSNAVKHSPRGGIVRVSVGPQDGFWRVSVTDNGPGIPEAFRAKIFGKFVQADGSDRRQAGGTGLGLSICKAIIDRLGGRIGYDSEENVRTTFYFDLPRMRRDTEDGVVPARPEAGEVAGGGVPS